MPRCLAFVSFAVLVTGCVATAEPKTKRPAPSSDESSGSPMTDDPELQEENGSSALPTDPPPPPTKAEGAPAGDGDRKTECAVTNGNDHSVARIDYAVDGSTLTVRRLEIEMTNASHRDLNGVTVFVTPPGGSEVQSFSATSLPDGKTTSLTLPESFKPPPNASVRVETHWNGGGWWEGTTGWCSLFLKN